MKTIAEPKTVLLILITHPVCSCFYDGSYEERLSFFLKCFMLVLPIE